MVRSAATPRASRTMNAPAPVSGPRPSRRIASRCSSESDRKSSPALSGLSNHPKTNHFSSWPGLSRPSTSFLLHRNKDVDARHKAVHDELQSEAGFCWLHFESDSQDEVLICRTKP